VEDLKAFLHDSIPGLSCALNKTGSKGAVELKYDEPAGFDQAEYPLETSLKIVAKFKGLSEPRLLEKVVSIKPVTAKRPPPTPRPLKDVPTFLRISGHQPMRLISGGADTHVRISWDGKDELLQGPTPQWRLAAKCKSHAGFLIPTFTSPNNGKFEALVHTPADWLIGTKLEFEIQASGPANQIISALFAAEIVSPPGPRKVDVQLPSQGKRRPPYQLVIISEPSFGSNTRWGEDPWTGSHSGAFIEPKEKAPLTLCINQDFGLLKKYLDGLIAKKADEHRTEERKTKYISHIAYHLYQMYLAKDSIRKEKEKAGDDSIRIPADEEMQEEVNRVASTLIRLMEVSR
jgi:hypothetical protein